MIGILFTGEQPLVALVMLLAYLIVIVLAFSSHEWAHSFVAYKMGDNTPLVQGRLSLNPFRHVDPLGLICLFIFGFGWAKPVNINPLKFRNYKTGMSLVSLAGVTTNLIFAFIASAFFFFFGGALIASSRLICVFAYYLLLYAVIINLSLFFFNLIPIYPLDGFNFIKTFMNYGNSFVNFMYKYGSIVLVLFVISPFFDILYECVVYGLLNVFSMFWGLFL